MINVLRIAVLLLLLPACSGRLYNYTLVKNHNEVGKQTNEKRSAKHFSINIAGKTRLPVIYSDTLTINKMIIKQAVIVLSQTKNKSLNNLPVAKRKEADIDNEQDSVFGKQISKKPNIPAIMGFTFSIFSIGSLVLGFSVSEVFFIIFLSLLLVSFIIDLIAIRQMNKNYGKYNNKWMVTVSMAINMLLMSFLIRFLLGAILFGFFFIY